MSNYIKIQHYKSPIGELILGSFNDKLCLADWRYRKMRDRIDKRLKDGLKAEFIEETSPIIEKTIIQFTEYFTKERTKFDVDLLLVGTDFQKKVWKELIKIPYGKTNSYMDLSKKLNNIKAIRAVASANGANAISILVPCHRIIGSDGKLVGYAGGLPIKKKLLLLEGAVVENQLSLF
jgi:methylated-DNA-[protein]-cysteine S-methyltransferase